MAKHTQSNLGRVLHLSAGRAFTLSEMLVAVGAVAVISVGLAAVFQTVGRTVTTGKRLSNLNQQAAILEAQLREDIGRMTRDGILVMRHQFTNLYGDINGGGNPSTGQQPVRVPPRVNKVALYKDQPVEDRRARRIDELMFFANGEFRSLRQSLIPGKTATARSARIYYGHGTRQTPVAVSTGDDYSPHFNSYYLPDFRGNFVWIGAFGNGIPPVQARPYVLGEPTRANERVPSPNEFASEWTLLRHATLLTGSSTTDSAGWPEGQPRPVYSDSFSSVNADLNRLASDGVFQVGGQPATPSIFRTFNDVIYMGRGFGPNAGNRNFAIYWSPTLTQPNNASTDRDLPRFASGVVDVSTSDLRDLKLVINGMSINPQGVPLEGYGVAFWNVPATEGVGKPGFLQPPMPKIKSPIWDSSSSGDPRVTTPYFLTYTRPQTQIPASVPQTDAHPLSVMQGWMLNALPVVSGITPTVTALENVPSSAGGGYTQLGQRIRYEAELPDLRGTLDPPLRNFQQGDNVQYAVDRGIARAVDARRAEMIALSSNIIAPRCSEFIVEWSFGQTYPDNTWLEVPDPTDPTNQATKQVNVSRQVIWYGGTLNPFSDTDQSVTPRNKWLGVLHYNPANEDPNNLQVDAKTSTPLVPKFEPFKGDTSLPSKVQNYAPSTYLIHGTAKRHPSYPLDQASLVSYFGYIDPTYIPDDGKPAMPWPWPTMLRVTFTLADASDPSLEQTFQYVFDLPPGQDLGSLAQ